LGPGAEPLCGIWVCQNSLLTLFPDVDCMQKRLKFEIVELMDTLILDQSVSQWEG